MFDIFEMEDCNLDLSFLKYRDAEDAATDAMGRWREHTQRGRECKVLENAREWAEVTAALPPDRSKPTFSQLDTLRAELKNVREREVAVLDHVLRVTRADKKREQLAKEVFEKESAQKFQKQREKISLQKQHRDEFIKQRRDREYKIPEKIGPLENVSLIPSAIDEIKDESVHETVVSTKIVRMKTDQEMFQDLLDVNYLRLGDEVAARSEAVVELINLGFDYKLVDTLVPVRDRSTDFESRARDREIEEIVTEIAPEVVETEEMVEKKITEDVERELNDALEKLKESQQLVEENVTQQMEVVNVCDDMSAWWRIHSKNVPREERERLDKLQKMGPEKLKMVAKPDARDESSEEFLRQLKRWEQEDQERLLQDCVEKIERLRNNFEVCRWLLSLDCVTNCTEARLDLDDSVILQVELEALLSSQPDIHKASVENVIQGFLREIQTSDNKVKGLSSVSRELRRKFLKDLDTITVKYGPHFVPTQELITLRNQIPKI